MSEGFSPGVAASFDSPDLSDLQRRWVEALPAFRERGVVFVSRTPFWAREGFVQRSLAYLLVKSGVEVQWWDASAWRLDARRRWVDPHPRLKVAPLWTLPGRRFEIMQRWTDAWHVAQIQKGWDPARRPFVWVQDGINDAVAEKLKAVDIFSVFDDPYVHDREGALCTKATRILCQNQFATTRFAEVHPEKTKWMPPPMDLPERTMARPTADVAHTLFPNSGVKTVAGYFGVHFGDGFDFDCLEACIEKCPNTGFLLIGKTNAAGERRMRSLRMHPRFRAMPWMQREELPSWWRGISTCLLFYRDDPRAHGAFPVKAMEAFSFGVRVVGTDVTKTRDLRADAILSQDTNVLARAIEAPIPESTEARAASWLRWRSRVHPLAHLCEAAEVLRAQMR